MIDPTQPDAGSQRVGSGAGKGGEREDSASEHNAHECDARQPPQGEFVQPKLQAM